MLKKADMTPAMIRIEPDWNVKRLLSTSNSPRVAIRIEPDWNVK